MTGGTDQSCVIIGQNTSNLIDQAWPGIRGSSPWTLTTIRSSGRPSRRTSSATRSEPDAWSFACQIGLPTEPVYDILYPRVIGGNQHAMRGARRGTVADPLDQRLAADVQ